MEKEYVSQDIMNRPRVTCTNVMCVISFSANALHAKKKAK